MINKLCSMISSFQVRWNFFPSYWKQHAMLLESGCGKWCMKKMERTELLTSSEQRGLGGCGFLAWLLVKTFIR